MSPRRLAIWSGLIALGKSCLLAIAVPAAIVRLWRAFPHNGTTTGWHLLDLPTTWGEIVLAVVAELWLLALGCLIYDLVTVMRRRQLRDATSWSTKWASSIAGLFLLATAGSIVGSIPAGATTTHPTTSLTVSAPTTATPLGSPTENVQERFNLTTIDPITQTAIVIHAENARRQHVESLSTQSAHVTPASRGNFSPLFTVADELNQAIADNKLNFSIEFDQHVAKGRLSFLRQLPNFSHPEDPSLAIDDSFAVAVLAYLALHHDGDVKKLELALTEGRPQHLSRVNGAIQLLADRHLVRPADDDHVVLAHPMTSDWSTLTSVLRDQSKKETTALIDALSAVSAPLSSDLVEFQWLHRFGFSIAMQLTVVNAAHELATRSLRRGEIDTSLWAIHKGQLFDPFSELLLGDLLLIHEGSATRKTLPSPHSPS